MIFQANYGCFQFRVSGVGIGLIKSQFCALGTISEAF